MLKGIKYRLFENSASCLGEYRRNYVYKLGKAGNLYPVAMPEKSNQHGAYHKSVLKIIDILKYGRSNRPALIRVIVGVIPNVPLVK